MAKPDDDNDAPSSAGAWLSMIDRAVNDLRKWEERCKKIRARYRYDNSSRSKRRHFQILWSNLQVMQPATYSRAPEPVVQSRFKDGDPVARLATLLIERALTFQIDFKDYDRTFKLIRDDYLLYGRGVPRLRYEPIFEEAETSEPLDETVLTGQEKPDEDDAPEDVLTFESVCVDYVGREDFIHPMSRTWEELPWIAYRAFLTRDELKERFGDELGSKIPLDARPEFEGNEKAANNSLTDKATVYEIWNKTEKTVLWVAKNHPDILESGKPYLKLEGFFPSPRPAYGTLTPDTLEPVPDYVYYQDQAEEIDDLTARIASLSDSLKLVGFYPAGPQGEGQPEIERAVKPGFENKMVAVKSWAMFKEGGGGGAPIVYLPVENVAKILTECIELRKQLIDDVYQITGISDILRGETEASETLGAQQMKARAGGTRMAERRDEVVRVARDVIRMAAEIISEHFQVSTLCQIANMPVPTEADVQQAQMQAMLAKQQWQQQSAMAQQMGQPAPPPPPDPPQMGPTQEQIAALLKDGMLRRFRIDVETDSTVAQDDAQERQQRTEFISATTQFITAWGPICAQQPVLAPLAMKLLMFGVQSFRVARELENTIEEVGEKLEQVLANPPPPQPDPTEQVKLEAVKVKAQAEQAKAQSDIEATHVASQAAQMKAQTDVQTAQQKAAIEGQKMQNELVMSQAQHEADMHMAAQKHGLDIQKMHAQHQAAVAKAKMQAQARPKQ